RNRITYVLEHDATQTPGPSTPDPVPEGDLDHLEFRSLLAPALECVEVSDLLCVELTLDDIRAIHTLTPSQSAELSRIYGFVYHRLGDYERAIAAYEDAARPFTDASGAVRGLGISALMTVALIHYERHRYQEALDAVIRYLRAAPNPSLG